MSKGFVRMRALLREAAKRKRARDALRSSMAQEEADGPQIDTLLEDAHPKQAAAVNDPGRLIAVLGTRRSGKSRGFLRRMLLDAVTIPNSYQIYINTSWPECRRIAWRGAKNQDGLIPLNKKYDLGAVINKQEHTLTFPNGSCIECIGADNMTAVERALGIGPHRVWIDEAQKMPHLDYLVIAVLGPALADFDGQVILTGTPSVDCAGMFFNVTRDNSELVGDKMWHVHLLNVLDNPHFGTTREERYGKTIARHCEKFNMREDDPEVLRDWFGKWVLSDSNFVYHVHRVDEEKLCYAPMRYLEQPRKDDLTGGIIDIAACRRDLPRRPGGTSFDWFYGLGIDIGYAPDPFAYVLWAWNWDMPTLFELFSWKQQRLIPDEQAAIINDLVPQFEFTYIVADAGGGGMGIVKGWSEGYANRYPIAVDEAKKSMKVTNIAFVNNDIRAGTLLMRDGSPYHHEMQHLTWSPQKGTARRVEDVRRDKQGRKKNPNDCCDAGLYAHREAAHHRFTPTADEIVYDSPEYWDNEEHELEELACGMTGGSHHVH